MSSLDDPIQREAILTVFRRVLTPREMAVMVALSGLDPDVGPLTYAETASRLGVTQAIVHNARVSAGGALSRVAGFRDLLRDGVPWVCEPGMIHEVEGAE